MKVVLTALNAKFVHTNLAVRYLKRYTEKMDYECVIKEFSINDQLERILEEIIKEKPQVVGFSCYIWNIDMVIKLAQLIKKVDNHIEILYGGPEVSYDSMEFLTQNEGEYLIEGEGEATYREFIEYKLCSREIAGIRGLYRKRADGTVEGSGPRPLLNMDELVFPYVPEDNFENRIVYYEASRGCPFRCKYCLSSTIQGVRFRNIDMVKEELGFLMEKGVTLVKFVDRTFNCNRAYAREIWRFLIGADTRTTFHFEISADLLTDEDITLLNTAPKGRFQFEIGVQTTNPQVVKNIDRTMSVAMVARKVQQLREKDNINLHLDLIAGLPGEDFESFKKSFNDVFYMKPHVIQLGFLKLLKGSSMREEEHKWGMTYTPYPPYEILKNNYISYDELIILKKVEEVVDKYHNSGRFNTILKYFYPKFQSPVDFYLKLADFFDKRGYFARSISGVDYYRILLEFNEKLIGTDEIVLKDIIKYDFLSTNKKNWIPGFLDRNVTKEEERRIKDILIEKYHISSTKGVYVEGFNIDIMKFVSDNLVHMEKCYVIYNNEEVDVKVLYPEQLL